MKTLSLLACALHFVAVLATSGAAFCVRADGHAGYEWSDDGCCGADFEAGSGNGPSVAAAPECGGCAVGLAPLPGGLHLDIHVAIPALVEAGMIEPGELFAEGETIPEARVSAEAVAPVSLPLRC